MQTMTDEQKKTEYFNSIKKRDAAEFLAEKKKVDDLRKIKQNHEETKDLKIFFSGNHESLNGKFPDGDVSTKQFFKELCEYGRVRGFQFTRTAHVTMRCGPDAYERIRPLVKQGDFVNIKIDICNVLGDSMNFTVTRNDR